MSTMVGSRRKQSEVGELGILVSGERVSRAILIPRRTKLDVRDLQVGGRRTSTQGSMEGFVS
jgi:hypothetical protein